MAVMRPDTCHVSPSNDVAAPSPSMSSTCRCSHLKASETSFFLPKSPEAADRRVGHRMIDRSDPAAQRARFVSRSTSGRADSPSLRIILTVAGNTHASLPVA